MTKVLLDETGELHQQLAASQARCREMEQDKEQAVYALGQLEEKYLQLQATLAAREEEVDRLKLAQQHSIQDECEAEQRLIDAGISDYEDGGQGEYRGLLTQIDLCIKERDAAVQEAGRLREALKYAEQYRQNPARMDPIPLPTEPQQARGSSGGAANHGAGA